MSAFLNTYFAIATSEFSHIIQTILAGLEKKLGHGPAGYFYGNP